MTANSERYRSIRTKLILPVTLVMAILLALLMFFFLRINAATNNLNQVYATNVSLNEVQSLLTSIQQNTFQYLNVQNEDSLSAAGEEMENFQNAIAPFNHAITNQEASLLEHNIYQLASSYLTLTQQALDAKTAHNVDLYRQSYSAMEDVYRYLIDNIRALDSLRFKANSENYDTLYQYLKYLEWYLTAVLAAVTLFLIFILYRNIQSITRPLERLAKKAKRISDGDFNVPEEEVISNDEVGTVASAFNQMIRSIQNYIERQRRAMETEIRMKEQELRSESLLKDAQLKYYQAQINPHFLFNTLNAGQQLAMMEGADRTYEFLDNTSAFFRYRLQKTGETSMLSQEIELVDHYMYIMNVRFGGEIHLEKDVDNDLLSLPFPGMTLQPLVENALNHGLREVDYEKHIWLSAKRNGNGADIEVRDNGVGMPQSIVDQINAGSLPEDMRKNTGGNGVGLMNVRERLKLFYQCDNVLFVTSSPKGTTVTIHIPLPEEGESNVQDSSGR